MRLAVRLGPTLLRPVQRNSPVLLVPTRMLASVLYTDVSPTLIHVTPATGAASVTWHVTESNVSSPRYVRDPTSGSRMTVGRSRKYLAYDRK